MCEPVCISLAVHSRFCTVNKAYHIVSGSPGPCKLHSHLNCDRSTNPAVQLSLWTKWLLHLPECYCTWVAVGLMLTTLVKYREKYNKNIYKR